MYDFFTELIQKPAPFSVMTVRELWTRPHLARQMLSYHLDNTTPLASRPLEEVKATVNYLNGIRALDGLSLCDLGCGPGLYTREFARLGAKVTGIDFSAVSIDYAKAHDSLGVDYMLADYVADNLPGGFDIVCLIYTDFCSLSPASRRALLSKIHEMLLPGGLLVLDVKNQAGLANVNPDVAIDEKLMGSFWAPGDYVGIQQTWRYDAESVSLDRYTILEPDDTWQIYNWCQYFSVESMTAELENAGFQVQELCSDFAGSEFDENSALMALVASRD